MPRPKSQPTEPKFLPDKPAKPLADKLLAGTAICSGIMLGLAMPGLIGTESWLAVLPHGAMLLSEGRLDSPGWTLNAPAASRMMGGTGGDAKCP